MTKTPDMKIDAAAMRAILTRSRAQLAAVRAASAHQKAVDDYCVALERLRALAPDTAAAFPIVQPRKKPTQRAQRRIGSNVNPNRRGE